MPPLPPLPYAVRLLALSHARAARTAVWTGVAVAAAAGFALSPHEWLVLGVTTALCGAAIRMVSAQLVAAWIAMRPERLTQAEAVPPADASSYDGATRAALAGLAHTLR